MKILASADLHIGRRPARVPHETAAAHSAANIWRRMVDVAIREKVEAVLLAGDILDAANHFYEAIGPLENGLDKLAEAKIKVVAVAGNHDWDSLPGLAASLSHPALRILGLNGEWEKIEITDDSGQTVQIFGWSFPDKYFTSSSIPRFPNDQVNPESISIGLLHADLDVSGSKYHPAYSSELRAVLIDAWVVGHVHASLGVDANAASPCILRVGSPQGLDSGPGERGNHGPWMIDLASNGQRSITQVPVAGVLYKEIDIDFSRLEEAAALQGHMAACLRRELTAAASHNPRLEAVVGRLHLTGTPAVSRHEIEREIRALAETGFATGTLQLIVEKVSTDFRPPVELTEFVDEPGVLGMLANLILEMEKGSCPPELKERALADLENLFNAQVFSPVAVEIEDESGFQRNNEEDVNRLLCNQARRLFLELYDQ